MKNLNSLKVGQGAKVFKIKESSHLKKRLLDLGLIPETYVECVGQSPAGDPKAFLIRGAVIAIRSEDCADILI